jgi:sterol desaturase/sphingolipid hydroxylase (fatty acid hydroxylase superfamily)
MTRAGKNDLISYARQSDRFVGTDMELERFERRDEKLLPPIAFYKRLIMFGLLSMGIILFSLGIGILGYMLFEGLDLVDAFLNAAMLMGGMGQVNTLYTDEGKIFSGFYAMYCGFILIFSVAIFMTPIFHRLLHHFHL